MACFKPMKGYRSIAHKGISFSPKSGFSELPMEVPCKQCIGCRLERSRQWAVRMMHEASLHQQNSFITLTYDDSHMPPGGTLIKSHFQKFIRATRKKHGKLRYFHCGEYGDETHRPHYHALLFGFDFPDKYLWMRRNDHPVWRSASLERLWPNGHSEIGSATFESAAYVARYCVKKITGKRAQSHYQRVDPTTGEIYQLLPEYSTQSRRPGIGRPWIEKYHPEVYPSDEIITRGRQMKPPVFYDTYLAQTNPDLSKAVTRTRRANRDDANNTDERLAVREICTKARSSLYQTRNGIT